MYDLRINYLQAIDIDGLLDVIRQYPEMAEELSVDIQNDLTYNLKSELWFSISDRRGQPLYVSEKEVCAE